MNYEDLGKQISNKGIGYAIVRGLFSSEEIDRYRNECNEYIKKGRKVYARIIRDDLPDYVHPRTVFEDGTIGTPDMPASNWRIYQYFHNKHTDETESFFKKVLTIRDRIEQQWEDVPGYLSEKQKLINYNIVTKYIESSNGLPKHIDYRGEAPFPFIQSVVLLSTPEIDYKGGDFILYSKDGSKVSLQNDLKMEKGDVFFFDKSLPHEVLPTEISEASNIGRWSVLIGARAKKRGSRFDLIKYSHPISMAKIKLKKLLDR